MDNSDMMRNFSWVEPYLESPWVKAMGIFAPAFPPPDVDHSSEAFRHFLTACGGGAAVLAFAGAVAAVWVLFRSCCCCCGRRQSSRPSVKPLICMGFLTLLLTLAGMFTYLLVGQKGVSLTMDSISRTTTDISSAAEQGETLSALGREASATLNSTIPKCKEAAQTYLHQFQQQLESYRELVDEYNSDMAGIPGNLSSVHSALDDVSEFGMYGLAAPLALVLLCCFAIVVLACTARSAARGNGRRSRCCVHSLGLVLFAPAILVVGAVTAAEFGFGLATASFCKDVDTNALTYIKYYADDLTYNVSRYYISAVGTNPLLDRVREANETIVNLEMAVDKLGGLVATNCTDAGPAVENISATLKSVHAPLSKVDDLLSPANLYPLYKTAIHDDACTTVISGVAWLVLIQFVVGIVCLPKLTCMADKFLDGWVSYRAHQANQANPATRVLLVPAGMQLREGTV